MIDVKDLQLVRFLAETGSITGAARLMHVTQSATSQRLNRLQVMLEIPLFERIDGQMRPTPGGRRLLNSALLINEELESFAQDLDQFKLEKNSCLRITTQCYTCYRWLPFVLRDLRFQLPELEVDVVPEATDRSRYALENDLIDIAIVSSPEAKEPFPSWDLFDDELYAVMHSTHSLARQDFIKPEQFSEQTLILYTGNRHDIMEEILKPAGVAPVKIIQVRITEAIVELARSGQGIAVLSGWAFADLDNSEGLVAVRIAKNGFQRTWRAEVRPDYNKFNTAAFVKSVQRIGALIQQQDWRRTLQNEYTIEDPSS